MRKRLFATEGHTREPLSNPFPPTNPSHHFCQWGRGAPPPVTTYFLPMGEGGGHRQRLATHISTGLTPTAGCTHLNRVTSTSPYLLPHRFMDLAGASSSLSGKRGAAVVVICTRHTLQCNLATVQATTLSLCACFFYFANVHPTLCNCACCVYFASAHSTIVTATVTITCDHWLFSYTQVHGPCSCLIQP